MSKSEERLTALRMSADQARARLAEQIRQGEELSKRPIGTEGDLQQLKTDRGQWFSFTKTLLQHMVTTDELVTEFTRATGVAVVKDVYNPPTLASQVAKEQEGIASLVARLNAVHSKIELYAEPTGITANRDAPRAADARSVFIVHGHDHGTLQTVARFIEKLQLTAIILHEQPNRSRTIIEKFEAHSNVRFAIVLLTPDDKGGVVAAKPEELQPRARQNVVLELGYFIGALGRENVCALYKSDVELPSDMSGVLYVSLDSADWRSNLAREMKAAGIEIDGSLVV